MTEAGIDARMSQKTPEEHAKHVAGMFGRIVSRYDLANHLLSFGQDYWWRYKLAREITPGPTGRVLDLAAGTLDVSLEITRQKPETRVLAMDFTHPMLVHGLGKIKSGRDIQCVTADARLLPLPDACVDHATIAFGIRNILPRSEAFAEMHRVLVPGGKACVLEFGSGRKRIFFGAYNFYLRWILPHIGRLVAGDGAAYDHLADTIRGFPSASELDRELLDAGFARVEHRSMMSGIVYLHVARKAE